MKKLDTFPETARASRYPWDAWMDGGINELTRGTLAEVREGKADYSGRADSIRAGLRRRANQLGKDRKTAIVKDEKGEEIGLVVQVFDAGSEAAANGATAARRAKGAGAKK